MKLITQDRDKSERQVAALAELISQSQQLSEVLEAAVHVTVDRLPDRDVLLTVLSLDAQAKCVHGLLRRHGASAPTPIDAVNTLRDATARLLADIESVASQAHGDEDVYVEEISILEELSDDSADSQAFKG